LPSGNGTARRTVNTTAMTTANTDEDVNNSEYEDHWECPPFIL